MSKQYLRSTNLTQTVSRHGFRLAHDLEFEDDASIDDDVTVTAASLHSLPCNNSDEQFCHNEDEVLSTDCGGFRAESLQCNSLSDDELLELTKSKSMYAHFIKEDDTSSDIFSDVESSCGSDSETLAEECGREDDVLFAGAPITTTSSTVLILSFVMKYKLTQEAFRDLLAVIEAHCPRPNNCKKEVKKLFEFVSQAKGNILNTFFVLTARHIVAKVLRIIEGKVKLRELVTYVVKILLILMDSSLKLQLLNSCKHFLEVSSFEVYFKSFFCNYSYLFKRS